jgi:hypothetical protein
MLFKTPTPSPQVLHLRIGTRLTGIAIERDAAWPAMWRVRRGDELSDVVNISRARDAAIAWARPKGLGGGEVVSWRRRQTPAEAPCARSEVLPERIDGAAP